MLEAKLVAALLGLGIQFILDESDWRNLHKLIGFLTYLAVKLRPTTVIESLAGRQQGAFTIFAR